MTESSLSPHVPSRAAQIKDLAGFSMRSHREGDVHTISLIGELDLATSHWSLIRSRKHYPSDVIGGGVLAVAVTATAWKLRPPRDRAGEPKAVAVASRRERPGRLGAVKRSAMRFVTNRLVNHVTRPLLERGWWPRTQALIETIGRTSGVARRVPVGNGLRGEQFWIVTEHGYGADYVKNLQHQPRMRVRVGRDWHHGTAHILGFRPQVCGFQRVAVSRR